MVNVAILGTGFGKEHARIYDQLENVEVVGIFGRDPEKLQALEAELGVRTTMDIESLVTDATVDLVDICLPTSLHADYTTRALAAGKHVYVETPAAVSAAQAEQMKQCAAENNRLLFVDLFLKFSPPHKYAIDAVNSGGLGRPLTLSAYNKTAAIWGNLGLDRIVLNFMLHNFDLVSSVMGVPREVAAVGIGRRNSAHVVSTLNYSEGFALIESSSMMPGGFEFDLGFSLACEGGTITYSESTESTVIYYKNGNVKTLSLSPTNDWQQAIEHVVECLERSRNSPYLGIDQAIQSLRIAEAVNQSLRTGGSVVIEE